MTRDQLIEKRRRKKQRRRILAIGGAAAAAVVIFTVVHMVKSNRRTVGGKKEEQQTQSVAEVETYDTDTAQRATLTDGRVGEVGWNADDNGWWYLNSDGTVFINGWKTIDGQQYWFRDTGYMATGWVNTGGVKDSYFDEAGRLDSSKQQKLVALTYDDGPAASTEKVLDALQRYNAKATFFVVGQQAEYYDEFLAREAEMGMEIGNHTYDHPWLNQLSMDEIDDEISHNDRIIEGIVGFGTKLLRPTGGGISPDLINAVTKPMIQWDVDTLDWDHLDAEKTAARIKELTVDGSVILMHDLFAPSGDAADEYMSWLTSSGYKMVTVSQIAEAYGYDLEVGGQYYAFYPDGCDLNMTKAEGLVTGKAAFD